MNGSEIKVGTVNGSVNTLNGSVLEFLGQTAGLTKGMTKIDRDNGGRGGEQI